jgi:hypothetical protein
MLDNYQVLIHGHTKKIKYKKYGEKYVKWNVGKKEGKQ